MSRTLALLALLFSPTACRRPAPAGPADAGRVTRPKRAPLGQDELPTTDAAIAVGNLEAQIDSLERAARPSSADHAALVTLLTVRGQFLGRLADYDRALALADQGVRERRTDAQAWLTRAAARATLHQFAAAAADLAHAEQLGAPSERVEALRASLDEAQGRMDEALAARVRLARLHPDLESLGLEAGLRAERGELEAAERLFVEAQDVYRDVSPFAVAWLYLQNGLVEERAGRLATARTFYQEAHLRLPLYAAAAAHLAGVEAALEGGGGGRDRAIALLRPLVERSDDPEYWGQLAGLLRAAGQTEEADRMRQIAADRYDALCRLHPEAYAEHAARFWMGPGNDAQQALTWAQRNRAARPTAEAQRLLVEAATAAHQDGLACRAAEQALLDSMRPSTALRLAAARAFSRCGKLSQSEALLAPDAGAADREP